MTAFRTLLVILLIAVVIYTIPVVINEGLSLLNTDLFRGHPGDDMAGPVQFRLFLVF